MKPLSSKIKNKFIFRTLLQKILCNGMDIFGSFLLVNLAAFFSWRSLPSTVELKEFLRPVWPGVGTEVGFMYALSG